MQKEYKDIYSLRPAHYLHYKDNICIHRYWNLKEEAHTETLEETISKVKDLVKESTLSQIKNKEVTSMLSGGLDSTILTSILTSYQNQTDTYSISYENQKEYFKSYDYQTTMDDEYIEDAISRGAKSIFVSKDCNYQNEHNVNIIKVENPKVDIARMNNDLYLLKYAKYPIMIGVTGTCGKTTSSKRLAIQLMCNLLVPQIISLDNYFVNRTDTPRDESGDYDYESLYALDLELFNHDLNALIAGEEVEMPTYNFETGMREFRGNKMKLGKIY